MDQSVANPDRQLIVNRRIAERLAEAEATRLTHRGHGGHASDLAVRARLGLWLIGVGEAMASRPPVDDPCGGSPQRAQ